MEMQHRELSFEDDDGNNISKDDSEDFAVEDTAFFRTTSGGTSDQPSGGGSDLLSPAASPTPFGTPRVWSAHSLYGEALVHSTRQLSAGNNTVSTMADDDDKVLGPQQPFFSQAEGPIYEDLLVSPSSPISDTPTTPPSVARKPSLSPPPLIQPELRPEEHNDEPQPQAPPPLPATAALNAITTTIQNTQTMNTLMPPHESMSYSSRTPLRPPRVPGNPQGRGSGGGGGATNNTTTASVNNSSGRQHRRNGSDSSFMSALTDVSFGSVQTAPPPPRSLPLPLLSSSSSWTRYTNGLVGNNLPVLDNHVSGMNISVPASLQQPFLSDYDNTHNNNTTDGPPPSQPSGNAGTNTGLPTHRQSTPPRHRPPKDSKSSTQQKVARPNASVPVHPPNTQKLSNKSGMSSSLAASSQALARQHLQNRHGPNSPSNVSGNSAAAAFLPIQRRTRSYSSDSQTSTSPKAATKPRSYSSDVILPPTTERSTPAGTHSLPSSVPPWEPPRHGLHAESINNENDDDTCGPVQLGDWFVQAFSRMNVSQRSNATDRFGAALLALEARSAATTTPQEDPPLRKIASTTSTMTDVSRLSTSTRQQPQPQQEEPTTLEPRVLSAPNNAPNSARSEWAIFVGVSAMLVGQIMLHGQETNAVRLLVFIGFENPLLLLLSRFLANSLPVTLDPSPRAWHACLSDEFCLAYLLSRGWPRVLILWATTEWLYFLSVGNTAFTQSVPFTFSLRLSLVALVAGSLETLRRFGVGVALHTLLYRRFCRKVQRTLQRVAVVRSIARFARLPIRDGVAISKEPASSPGQVPLKELVAFQKIYAAFHSDRALSPDFGSVENKELKASAATLHDAVAVQGRVRLSALQEATTGTEAMTPLVQVMFSSSPNGVVSQPDFIASIETLYENVNCLLRAVDAQVSSLRFLDTSSSAVMNLLMLSLGCGAILPLVLSSMIALVCAVALSTCFEAVIFALFARPFDVGDVIVLNWHDDSLPVPHEQGWKVEEVGLWNTKVTRDGMNTGITVLSNASLARCRITTFDSSVPTVIPLRFRVESQVSRQKLKEFRTFVEQYLRGRSGEWIDLLSMHVTEIRSGSTEYELRVRPRQQVGNFCAIRQSRVDLMSFCLQTQALLGMSTVSALNLAKDIGTGYNDDLSEDTAVETDNELYFLANTN